MRFVRFLVAFHWFIWASIIIPAHTRGTIQLPGATSIARSCCADHQNPGSKSPTNSEKSNCAVCYFAAHIMPAVCLPVDLKPGEFVESVIIAPVQSPSLPEPSLCHPSRAPPVATA